MTLPEADDNRKRVTRRWWHFQEIRCCQCEHSRTVKWYSI